MTQNHQTKLDRYMQKKQMIPATGNTHNASRPHHSHTPSKHQQITQKVPQSSRTPIKMNQSHIKKNVNKLKVSQETSGKDSVQKVQQTSQTNRLLKPLLRRNQMKDKGEKSIDNKQVALKQEREQSKSIEMKEFVGPQLILIGPFDSMYGQKGFEKLSELMQNCCKKSVINWISQRNSEKDSPRNLKNIQKIDDEQFWCTYMQKIIGHILNGQNEINSCIHMLPQQFATKDVILSRRQIFLLISCMFLSILPSQINNKRISFAQLMTIHDNELKHTAKPQMRFEKLKCIINYLKFMTDNEDIFQEEIIYRRVYHSNKEYLTTRFNTHLCSVLTSRHKIQAGYGQGILIDFANSNVGGGFLTSGCAQQQILFSIFPEMIITKVICCELVQEEGVVVNGVIRVNDYEGYSDSFRFKGSYSGQYTRSGCIAAVDAIDFTHGVMKLNPTLQYSAKYIKRQVHKMYLTIRSAVDLCGQSRVFTGRWGCGVFGGDEVLKFCIQWIACSLANLEMHFMTNNQSMQKQLTLLFQNVRGLNVGELLSLLYQFGLSKKLVDLGLLNYLKYHV